jgi:hypothetical protein
MVKAFNVRLWDACLNEKVFAGRAEARDAARRRRTDTARRLCHLDGPGRNLDVQTDARCGGRCQKGLVSVVAWKVRA